MLRAHRPCDAVDDAFVFAGRAGGASDQGSLRRRVLVPAAERAGLTGVGFHTLRHTCASMLIESGLSPLRLQRWMGHHSPAFTLETYGHLIDGDLGPALDLHNEAGIGPASIDPAQRDRQMILVLSRPVGAAASRHARFGTSTREATTKANDRMSGRAGVSGLGAEAVAHRPRRASAALRRGRPLARLS